MSLCDAKKSTTSRFSFLIGTISNRHQNGVPTNYRMKELVQKLDNNDNNRQQHEI